MNKQIAHQLGISERTFEAHRQTVMQKLLVPSFAEAVSIAEHVGIVDPICFSPRLYRARNLIEPFFNKLKQCRRVVTRYYKLAANYLAFVKLASICIWLRANESAP